MQPRRSCSRHLTNESGSPRTHTPWQRGAPCAPSATQARDALWALQPVTWQAPERHRVAHAKAAAAVAAESRWTRVLARLQVVLWDKTHTGITMNVTEVLPVVSYKAFTATLRLIWHHSATLIMTSSSSTCFPDKNDGNSGELGGGASRCPVPDHASHAKRKLALLSGWEGNASRPCQSQWL